MPSGAGSNKLAPCTRIRGSNLQGENEELRNRLREIQKSDRANNKCMNCNAQLINWFSVEPTYVCLDLLTFVCQSCSDVHCEFGHRVGSIDESAWTEEQVDKVEKGGNALATEKWLDGWNEELFPRPSNTDVDQIKNFVRKAYVIKCWKRQPKHGEVEEDIPCAALPIETTPGTKEITTEGGVVSIKDEVSGSGPGVEGEDISNNTRMLTKFHATEGAANGVVATAETQQDAAPKIWAPKSEAPKADSNPKCSFCLDHNSVEKRQKEHRGPWSGRCRSCRKDLTGYKGCVFCPGCSLHFRSCMVCGEDAAGCAGWLGDKSGGSTPGSTSVGDADSGSDSGSAGTHTSHTVAPNTIPTSALNDLLDFDIPAVDHGSSQVQQHASVSLPQTIPIDSLGDLADLDLTAPAIAAQPPTEAPAVGGQQSGTPALTAVVAAVDHVAQQPPTSGCSNVAPSTDVFASIKDLYNVAPKREEPLQERSERFNALLEMQPAPRVSYAPGNLNTMQNQDLLQLQAMVGQALQQRQMPQVAGAMVSMPSAEYQSFNSLQQATPIMPSSNAAGPPTALIDESPSKSLVHKDAEFGDLLGAMQEKAVGWEARGSLI